MNPNVAALERSVRQDIGDRVDDPELDGNFTKNQQHDPIAHFLQTNLRIPNEEQNNLI
jgi:hypothetical protein